MRKILVLEGDSSVREAFRRYLSSHGYEVVVVGNNDDAITCIAQLHEMGMMFDGAVLDGSLSTEFVLGKEKEFDTLPTLVILQEARVPVILAGSGHPHICQEMMKAGCTHSVDGEKTIAPRRITELVPLT